MLRHTDTRESDSGNRLKHSYDQCKEGQGLTHIHHASPSLAPQVDEAQKALQFVTISSDGCVNIWTLNKSELTHEFLMKLRKEGGESKGDEGGEEAAAAGGGGMSGGCCMDFNKGAGQEHIYLVRGAAACHLLTLSFCHLLVRGACCLSSADPA